MRFRVLFRVIPRLLLFAVIAAAAANAQTGTGFAEVNGGKLYYEVAGSGHALVLIHGGQMDRRMWDEQFALRSTSR